VDKQGVTRAFGLRTKIAFVALVLLVIPWVGWNYLQAMESLLRQNQEQRVLASARAVAVALQDRPRLLELEAPPAGDGEPALPRAAAEQVQLVLGGLARPGLRLWVLDARMRIVATAGNLDAGPPPSQDDTGFGPVERLVHRALRPVFERVLTAPTVPAEEFIPNDVFSGPAVERALDGMATSRRRVMPGGDSVILSAAHPVWVGEKVIGVAVVEENTDAIVTLRNRALEQLAAVTLIAFGAAALVLFFFASRLTFRLKRLRDEAENAIDSQGRVRQLTAGERAGDEIGDLSRSFSTALARLADYNLYLEKLSGRLSHELRTPVAVVRSSLDNLRLAQSPEETETYLARANDGLRRLDTILTRMGEATRLEQTVRADAREVFDARAVVSGCVAGYTQAYPQRRFVLTMAEEPVMLSGAPDLLAQLLDKLAANAADFAEEDMPVEVALRREGHEALLTFANRGPALPAEMAGRLFESMVSVRRDRETGEPHLGLGLYIVRLIAEYHGGRVAAANRTEGSGVVVTVTLPLTVV
jgi:dedicated sortase system histidine kinase